MFLEISTRSKYIHAQPQQREADMDGPRKFWHPWLRNGSLGQDELEGVAVGDPDPTADHGTVNGYRTCRFEWIYDISQTLNLLWSCTRELGHQGQHLAGTGEWVAAVHPQLLPTATATSISL
jgi:hypothetical protein